MDKNFFKWKPVTTDYGEGYVMEDNIDEFIFDENYNIYDDLRKRDCKRIEKIIKKEKEEEVKEKMQIKKKIKIKRIKKKKEKERRRKN